MTTIVQWENAKKFKEFNSFSIVLPDKEGNTIVFKNDENIDNRKYFYISGLAFCTKNKMPIKHKINKIIVEEGITLVFSANLLSIYNISEIIGDFVIMSGFYNRFWDMIDQYRKK